MRNKYPPINGSRAELLSFKGDMETEIILQTHIKLADKLKT